MDIQVRPATKAKLVANVFKLATVETVNYDPCEDIEYGRETIYMETTEGDKCEWKISTCSSDDMNRFITTREDIKAGKIVPGTEVTIAYRCNGIVSFGL